MPATRIPPMNLPHVDVTRIPEYRQEIEARVRCAGMALGRLLGELE